ncbi:lantibiotic dehydratase family protein [Polaribacter sp. Z022]|uniref:lantibiotic dehydratase family protein n=1 Tax=Polaribacter sp. Z022 TaxID=2927125 RepID=UPI002021D51B|nr:lantibiotic dehydratase family protein [Polaribacter sp. Z022]MCL7752468.1 lantibiotic dehydratase family protein [Polaribacter sp. Z022]
MLRKSLKTYQIFNNYCVRTPLFSFSYYKKFIQKDTLDDNDFKEILGNVIFREAVFLASPELYAQIIKWEKGALLDSKKIEKLQFSLLKYITRISTRCTPFGLFATCGVGEFGLDTNIQLNKTNKYKRHTRFDTTFLNQLFQELLKKPIIKENVLFYPNTSIYKIGNHYRYVEYVIENKKRTYSLEGLKHSEYLELILNKAVEGKTLNELLLNLINDEVTKPKALYFVKELIDNQILVSELELTITGEDYLEKLLKRIGQIPETSFTYDKLNALNIQLLELDKKLGNNLNTYTSITNDAKSLIPNLNSKYLFQTDTFSSFKNNTLQRSIKKQLSKALVILNKITLPNANGNLEQFKRDFLSRFEDSQELPLNLVLDSETGIGYGSKKEDSNDLLDDLIISKVKKRYQYVTWSDFDTILHHKLISSIQENSYTIYLDEGDFKNLPINWNDLTDTFSSIIEIYNIDKEEKIYISNAGGASATYLLGRFGSGNEEILSHINEIVAIESAINNDKILAEIVHLPEARLGNILHRPAFRDYEIPYLGKASVPLGNQIPIEDILVTVKNDIIILKSKKLGKEILPRLGNAHNFGSNSLPIYHFLCDLQTQNKREVIGFGWNPIFKQHSFLPRVEFNNIIFSKARWKVNVNDFKKLLENNNFDIWKKKNKIPDLVELVEGDNKLLIYFKNKFCLYMLLDTIKNRKEFILEEFLFSDEGITKEDKGHSYCNQFIVSFYNNEKLIAAGND